VPIVFAQTIDPVGLAFVDSLSRPGRQYHRLHAIRVGITSKWLELLKQIAPNITRAAVLRDGLRSRRDRAMGRDAVDCAGVCRWNWSVINVRDSDAIEKRHCQTCQFIQAGLLVTASAPPTVHRALILERAFRHRLPPIYPTLLCRGPAVWHAMDLTRSDQYAAPQDTSTEFSRVKSRRPCRTSTDQVRSGNQPEDITGPRCFRSHPSCSRAANEVIE